MEIILASASPRRRELMRLITPDYTVCASHVEETVPPGLTPAETVLYLARLKGADVFAKHPDALVVAADTVVAVDGVILGKPQNAEDAARMLHLLSGRTHAVYTGVYLACKTGEKCFFEQTDVTFYPLSDAEIAAYIATGEPFDKAGAYGIQGCGSLLVEGISGDYFNVVGFPVAKAARELKALQAKYKI